MPLYSAFGLTFDSQLALPELLKGSNEADVVIDFAEVPNELPNAKDSGVRFQTAPGQMLLKVDGIAKFLVQNGKRIAIEPHNNTSEAEIRLFLLGSVFGALLQQRGLLTLHGSSIEYQGRAIAFLGPSGVGKSTLASAFQKNGYNLLTDDICSVNLNRHRLLEVIPSYPQTKLWTDSLKGLNIDLAQLQRIRPQIEKRAVPAGGGFCPNALPLYRIYVLSPQCSEVQSITPITGTDKVTELSNNTYRSQFINGFGRNVNHFKLVTAIASSVSMNKMVRSQQPFEIDKLVTFVREDLEG